MPEQKWKRRTIVVDKEFQFRYLMTWVLLTTSLLAGIVLGSLSVLAFFPQDRTYFIWVNAICAALITAVSMYFIVIHSHRIAGPAFRLRKLMLELAEGRRGFRVKLRRKDYLKQVAEAMNALLDKMEEKEQRVNALGREMEAAAAGGGDLRGKVVEVARELQELCPKIEEVKVDGAP